MEGCPWTGGSCFRGHRGESSDGGWIRVRVHRARGTQLLAILMKTNGFSLSPISQRGTFKPTVWLQGSNQATHGISDTLLSVISIRSQEMVDGFFKNGHFE
ncbi:hypothetical protein BT69DRAFT_494468 [Atractiella rhizophila]|nr:hypothetical protein BT69DRAFT_494468 [Atractiella rhizophila]